MDLRVPMDSQVQESSFLALKQAQVLRRLAGTRTREYPFAALLLRIIGAPEEKKETCGPGWEKQTDIQIDG